MGDLYAGGNFPTNKIVKSFLISISTDLNGPYKEKSDFKRDKWIKELKSGQSDKKKYTEFSKIWEGVIKIVKKEKRFVLNFRLMYSDNIKECLGH